MFVLKRLGVECSNSCAQKIYRYPCGYVPLGETFKVSFAQRIQRFQVAKQAPSIDELDQAL